MITIETLKQDHGIEITALVLVCRVFVGTAKEDELKDYLLKNKIDWQAFYKITAIHQLRPLVFKTLYNLNIPKEVRNKLHADCRYITLQNFEHAKELTRLYRLLQQAGIVVVPWKGVTFSIEYYKDIGMREFCDIDFLINLNVPNLDTIKKIFEKLGYTDKSGVPDAFKEIHFNHTREYYFDFYENDKRKFHTEFHWYTASQLFDFVTPMPNTILFNNLNESDIYGTQIKTLNATNHFIAIVAHHGLNQRWGLLKYLIDLAQIIKNAPSLNGVEIVNTSKTFGFNKALNLGLSIANDLLGVESGIDCQKPGNTASYISDLLSSTDKKKKKILTTLFLSLKIKDDPASQMKMLYKYAVFAATPSILDYRFLKLPRSLFFLYPIVKPIRILANALKKEER